MSDEDVKLPPPPLPHRRAGETDPCFHQYTGKQMERYARRAILADRERSAGEWLADARRLDFLDRCNRSLNARYGTNYGWNLIINHNVVRLLSGAAYRDVDLHDSDGSVRKLPSCRAAIDAAMEGK